MSEFENHGRTLPKTVIEQVTVTETEQVGEDAPHAGDAQREGSREAKGFHDTTVGFIQGVGRSAWAYADAHPHAVLYGMIGFVLAALILIIGLWDTIVIAVFTGVGVAIGQMVDGDSAIVRFFGRLFGARR